MAFSHLVIYHFLIYIVGGGGGTLPGIGGVGGVGGIWKSGASAGTVPAAAHCGMPCAQTIVCAVN
jgi:hypothetical protein